MLNALTNIRFWGHRGQRPAAYQSRFMNTGPLVDPVEREAEREELLGPGDRQRARQPLAAERRDLQVVGRDLQHRSPVFCPADTPRWSDACQ
jgi:hypothetical protein